MVIKIKTNKNKINKYKTNKNKINKYKTNKNKINKYKTNKTKTNKTKTNKNKNKKNKTNKNKIKKYKTNKNKIGGVTNVSDLDKVKLFQSSFKQQEQIIEDSIKQMFALKRFDPNIGRRLDQLGTKSEGIILFDTINSQTNETVSYVLKEVKSPGHPKEEALFHSNKINEWNKILENYSTSHNNINIPIFAKYYDTKVFEEMNDTYLLYRLQFAPGDTLKKIAKNIQQKKYSNDEIEKIQTNIGEQLGYLIKAMYQYNKTIIMHGDLSDNNIIYDINTNKMYWIDLGGTHEISFVENELEYKNTINKLIKLFKKISTKPIIENIINTIEYSKI